MRRFALPGAITLVVVAFMIVLIVGLSNAGTGSALAAQVKAGKTPVAPDAQLKLPLLGTKTDAKIANYRGHYAMVDFFAGWCDACQEDATTMARAQKMLAKSGGTVVGVTFQDSDSDAQSYMRKYKLSYPVLHDSSDTVASAFSIGSEIPDSFIINPRGKVVAVCMNELTSHWLTGTLDRLLGQSVPVPAEPQGTAGC